MNVSNYNNVVKPDNAATWTLRARVGVLLPTSILQGPWPCFLFTPFKILHNQTLQAPEIAEELDLLERCLSANIRA